MTRNEFNRKFHGVVTDEYVGAPYPAFDHHAVNEKAIDNELRFKWYDFDFEEAKDGIDTITVKWQSYSWPNDALVAVNGLVEEVKRCLKSIGFIGNVVLDVNDRSKENFAHREFTVG